MKPLLFAAASPIVIVICFAQAPPTMFPPVRGLHELVGAANNFEVEAGYRMLTQGGNAVDAGVASVLAATVTEQSRVGLGGEIPILVKMSGRPVMAISGVGIAPAKATVEYYQHRPAGAMGGGGPSGADSAAGHPFGHYAGNAGRPAAGAGAIRHEVVRRGGGAGDRVCQRGIRDAG
jgi:hypothetical protein